MKNNLGNKKNSITFAPHKRNAAVAQLVEHQLPKLRVASSSLVCRSKPKPAVNFHWPPVFISSSLAI